MDPDTSQAPHWWGEYTIADTKGLRCHIGPLDLLLRNLHEEWQIAYERRAGDEDEDSVCHISESDLSLEHLTNHSRYILHDDSGKVYINPRLADRPIVSRPWSPFHLSAGQETTLYVSSPLWIEITVGQQRRTLEEIAILRPSDTWFGASTQEGELCYASRTSCRLRLDELPWRPHRALTPVVIRNRADTPLLLERLSLPVPLLPLFAAPDGRLWTPRVTLTRSDDGDMAALKIDKEAPLEVDAATLIHTPRTNAGTGTLVRAFNALFS